MALPTTGSPRNSVGSLWMRWRSEIGGGERPSPPNPERRRRRFSEVRNLAAAVMQEQPCGICCSRSRSANRGDEALLHGWLDPGRNLGLGIW